MKNTTFKYMPAVESNLKHHEELEKMETTKPEHKEVRIIVEEPEVKDITTMMDTEIRSVGELVAD